MLSLKDLIEYSKTGRTVNLGGRPSRDPDPVPEQDDSDDEKKDSKPDIKRLEKGTKYAEKYQQTENSRLIQASVRLHTDKATAGPSSKRLKIDNVDDDDEMDFALDGGGIDSPEIPAMSIYGKYSFNIAPQDLPIKLKRDEIMDQINKNMFIVLTANTGTGKSTQIPQYILEDARKRRQMCNIVVTQPRRIAGELGGFVDFIELSLTFTPFTHIPTSHLSRQTCRSRA